MRRYVGAVGVMLAAAVMSSPGRAQQVALPDNVPGTFSILGFDPQTGEIGAAVQSRVFSVGNGVLWAEAGVGAVATQAVVDVGYGPRAMELLRQGLAPKAIIKQVLDEDVDPNYNGQSWPKAGRQFAVIDARGETAAYTGPNAPLEFGDKQGRYVTAQGNTLGSKDVPAAMVDGFLKSQTDKNGKRVNIALRLVAGLEAGQAAGGDRRGQESAALIVVKKGCGVWLHNDVELHLQVDDNPEPIKELRRLVEMALAPHSGQVPCWPR